MAPEPQLSSRPPFRVAMEERLKRILSAILRSFLPRASPESLHLHGIKNILVVRQHDQLGDMLCVVPLLRALKGRFPDADIVLVASPVNYDVMRHHRYLNEVLNYDKKALVRSPAALIGFYRSLRKHGFDLAVVPSTVSVSLTSSIIAFLSGSRIRAGVGRLNGAVNPFAFLFNVSADLDWRNDPHRHQTRKNLDVLRPLGVTTDDLNPAISITEDEKKEADRVLSSLRAEHKILVGLHPGAGKRENCWPAVRFAEVANRLSDRCSIGAVITAGPKDDEPVNEMVRHIRCPYLIVRRMPIRTAASIASRLDLFVSNDTGMMHVAAATGVATLSLFGPSDPLQWAPPGVKNRYIQGENGALTGISANQVFSTAAEMLALQAK